MTLVSKSQNLTYQYIEISGCLSAFMILSVSASGPECPHMLHPSIISIMAGVPVTSVMSHCLLCCLQYKITIQAFTIWSSQYGGGWMLCHANHEVNYIQISIGAIGWSLHPELVTWVFTLLETLEVDLSALSFNHKLLLWFSWYQEQQVLS